MRNLSGAALALLAAMVVAAAEPSYFGKWRFNPDKSDLGPIEMTITQSGDEFQLTDQSKKSYKFKMDGKPYPDQYGNTVAWQQLKNNEWETIYFLKGKQIGQERTVLSADGRTLVSRGKTQVGEGPAVEQSTTLTRTGRGTGLVGHWSGGKLQMAPFVLEITPAGGDGLVFRIAGMLESKAKFDGKPYPLTGAIVQEGSTAAFTRVDERSFRTTQIYPNGKLDATVSVSPDGKTLTEAGVDETGLKRMWVFDRQ
jgi:hypothetical protein